jgi:hypothetical protein
VMLSIGQVLAAESGVADDVVGVEDGMSRVAKL